MGTPSLHCWANRATYSLFAPAPPLIPAPVEELFVLSKLTLAFCLWRGSAPFHIKARLCLWSGCESSPPQGLLCMSNTPFQWGSSFSIGQGSWIVSPSSNWPSPCLWGHPFQFQEPWIWNGQLASVPHFFPPHYSVPHINNQLLFGFSVTTPLNCFCC